MEFGFKSYSWVIGTTSFRVKEVNYKIEQQLKTLRELFEENPHKEWRELQVTYYDKLLEKGLVTGNAPRKDKDAREKTSGLKELGLITENRHLTSVGEEILRLVENEKIHEPNNFMIEADAFIYLKQLLKLYVREQEFNIRPFVALLYLIDKLEFLTEEEFTYLMPLCKNKEDVKSMVEYIKLIREGKKSINDIIILFMFRMQNYSNARKYFLSLEQVTCDDICNIGMNRKSRKYDAPYYDLYLALQKAAKASNLTEVEMNEIISKINKLKKPSAEWKKLLFGKSLKKEKQLEHFKEIFPTLGISSKDEIKFRDSFFTFMHLFKWRANLQEYADLNKRYFLLADILIFQNEKVELSLFSKYFFHLCIDKLLEEEIDKYLLYQNVSLEEISPALNVNVDDVVALVSEKTGKVLDIPSMRDHFNREKASQLRKLINEKFNVKNLIQLFTWIEERNDKKVQEYVTDNADVPTIFEYLVGIGWYHISSQSIDLLESWNLSLDANLLPKRHANGGSSDIVIEYPKTSDYPHHKLMLEVTLTNNTNQRRAEMEPVSRHLGTLKAMNKDKEVYALFISNHLDVNVIVDLRSRKDVPFYDRNTGSWIKDNKIIPLSTENIKSILRSERKYPEIYKFFDKVYLSETPLENWYDEEINKSLNNL